VKSKYLLRNVSLKKLKDLKIISSKDQQARSPVTQNKDESPKGDDMLD